MTERPTWNQYFLGIAEAVSKRADCTRRQVGAVIVDTQHRIVSTGYNGAPPNRVGCIDGGCPRGQKSYEEVPAFGDYSNCISNHAEANALLYGDRSKMELGTMYITDYPCFGCRKLIANSGLQTIVCPPVGGVGFLLMNVEDIL